MYKKKPSGLPQFYKLVMHLKQSEMFYFSKYDSNT